MNEANAPTEVTQREEATRPGRTYRPKVDIVDTENGLRLWADLPGVDEKSIEVELVDGVLTLRGRIATEEYESLEPLYTEYGVGDFEARFRLSSQIDADKIQAKLRNGVLELELPKVAAARPRKIEVAVH
jgi:HSP20 family molecular chaperone IbpA